MKKGTRTLWQCMLVASLAVLAACGGKTQVSEAPVMEPAVQTEYRIGPGDTCRCSSGTSPELTVTVPVRPDGMISTPLIAGRSGRRQDGKQLARDLETALAEFVRIAESERHVTGFVGAYERPDPCRWPGRRSRSRCPTART